jgi:hypothetical protein
MELKKWRQKKGAVKEDEKEEVKETKKERGKQK